MILFALRRLLQALILLAVVVTVVFFLARLSGNPAYLMASPTASPAEIEAISKNLGLDQPLYVQFFRFISQYAHGDLGTSFTFRAPVAGLVAHALPYSAELALAAFAFAFIGGLTLGTVSALYATSWISGLAQWLALLGQSVPSFWLGMLLTIVFAVQLGVLPAFGPGGFDHLILPALALSAQPLAAVTRLTQSATLDVLQSEHVVFERSKGVSPGVLMMHVLRNASLPVITLSGVQLGSLLSSTVVVETLFAWPGLGLLAIQSVSARDYVVLQAVVLVYTAIFVVLNLLVDISYGWLDPRVRPSH
jgi:peptide/nickel transport system permease protein